MNTIAFATVDITPEFWTDFSTAAGCEPPTSKPDQKVVVPYTLVHNLSPTVEQLHQRTQRIDSTIHTELASTPWPQIRDTFIDLSNEHNFIISALFLIIDAQSVTDRTVIVIENGGDWTCADGSESWNPGAPGVTPWVVWRKYRMPFEEAFTAQCGIEGFCSNEAAEPWFVEEIEKYVDTETREEVSEVSSSDDDDGMTSEDWEYGDFPIKGAPK